MTAAELPAALTQHFPQVTGRASGDCRAFDVPREALLEVLAWLRGEAGFDHLADITGIDWGLDASPRFGVAYHLFSTVRHDYVRLMVVCSPTEPPAVPSATALWPAADWHEREAYDFFGIRFEGHPDLRRILMWEGYPGFPMRKDFPLSGVETPLPDDEVGAETGTKILPAAEAGGPFVAPQRGHHISEREPRSRDESWSERNPKPAN